ncbi:MarR family winged helix-turn-helix transcriptional regulator [Micromonospora endolithica]|uniref:MarR family transcriptional regulator n=1 Tax=Micromonospora endolithica TaxID=230091 RepID=A0A3A9ZKX5_9ACTN|nr:MarR family winged helix-turn-helix transcriptional regulator [Micromonospora endolithica]RKN48715.1 MarR family transcriptional regulator [Micromonospora endolithica]TWJ22077.1 DNA-binding MarR family transcriptional regulator [Micromonospora endolithica]
MNEIPQRLAAKPSWLITQLAVHARRLVSEGFAAAGARGYHYRILAALDEFGPASQAQLGRRCRIDRSDVVAAVNGLVELGHVDRAPDPDHGRRNRVTLTSSGVRQLRRMDGLLDQVQDDLLAPLPAADRQTLTRLLSQVLAHHEPE